MIQDIKTPITVYSVFNHKKIRFYPVKLLWEGREYMIKSVGLRHSYRRGRELVHVFSCSGMVGNGFTQHTSAVTDTGGMFFQLAFYTESLSWEMIQTSDGVS